MRSQPQHPPLSVSQPADRKTLCRFINFMIALGGTESLDRKQGNKWPGEQALMTFLASRDDDGL